MENFILYEEIGKGANSIVYKGRRKGTIKFLAILCIEKDERAAITNWVRLTHEIDHKNIVKFHEWYETSNHLWMVVELCTGGTLEDVLKLDGCLPEKTICQFGRDILSGLLYLHEHGIVYADLCAKKVLLDGPGILKLTNFCLSRIHDENLLEVYEQAFSQNSQDFAIKYDQSILKGKQEFQSPEVLEDGRLTFASDIWSFGVLLYLMYTGYTPFYGETSSEISNNITNKQYEPPFKQRNRNHHLIIDNKDLPSDHFLDILSLTLEKDVDKRATAHELLQHPFWSMYDETNVDSLNSTVETLKIEDSLQINVTNSASLMNSDSLNLNGSTILKDTEPTPPGNFNLMVKSEIITERSPSRISEAPESVSVLDSTFTLSSRPHTAKAFEPESGDNKLNTTTARSPDLTKHNELGDTYSVLKKSVKSVTPSTATLATVVSIDDVRSTIKEDPSVSAPSNLEICELIYHTSDLEVPIVQDNPQVRKVEVPRFDAKNLPFQVLVSLDEVIPDQIYTHLKQVQQALTQQQSNLRVKTNVISYLSYLCNCSSTVANFVINSQLIGILTQHVKTFIQQSPDITQKAARCIGIAATCATDLEQSTRITEVFSSLVESLRENFRNPRVKLALIPALGQLLYFVAEQEEGGGYVEDGRPGTQAPTQRGHWSVPTATYSLLSRCLREGEDPLVQHYTCKIIECVTISTSQHGRRFITASTQGVGNLTSGHGGDVIGPTLWSVSERATTEGLKHAALSAMCRLNRLSGSGSVFQAILDRIGLPAFLAVLARASYKCQQSILTAFNETLFSAPKGQTSRLANGKDILPSLMRLLDSPSTLVRGKVILAHVLLLRRNSSLLMTACQHRLIMYIERDCRKAATPSQTLRNTPSNSEYLTSCLNLLIRHMILQVPNISVSCISILDEALGRKHPSTNQVKQLRSTLPTCIILHHMVTSQVFRSQVVTSEFVNQLGQLLAHATRFLKKSNATTTGITSAVGDEILQKYVDTVLSIVECLSQHPLVLTQHEEASMTALVPQLINLLGVYGKGDGQVVCVKLLTDVLGTLLHYRAISASSEWLPPSLPTTPMKTPSTRGSSRSSVRSARNRREDLPDPYGVCKIVVEKLLPDFQTTLHSREPLPAYAVRLLGTLLEHWPSISTHSIKLVPSLMALFDDQQCDMFGSCAQGLATVLTHLIRYGEEEVAALMYEHGLVDILINYLTDTYKQYIEQQLGEMDAGSATLIDALSQLLTLFKCMLDRVTVTVKKALQNNNVAASSSAVNAKARTAGAENLLVIHKPLTETQGMCIIFLKCEEQELCDMSLACLSMLVQLYGGDHPETFIPDNMRGLADVLSHSNFKTQRILLKLIKRIVSLNKNHSERMNSKEGSSLIASIQKIASVAEKRADSTLANLAEEVLQFAYQKN